MDQVAVAQEMRLDGTDWEACTRDPDYRERIGFCMHLKEETTSAVLSEFPPGPDEIQDRIGCFRALTRK